MAVTPTTSQRLAFPLSSTLPVRTAYRLLRRSRSNALFSALDGLKGVPFHILRAGASVALALGAGLRPVEIQHLQANGLDLINGLVTVEIVKGGATLRPSSHSSIASGRTAVPKSVHG